MRYRTFGVVTPQVLFLLSVNFLSLIRSKTDQILFNRGFFSQNGLFYKAKFSIWSNLLRIETNHRQITLRNHTKE